MQVRTVASLIDVIGGPSVVVRELRAMNAEIASPSTVLRWNSVNEIPVKWWRRLIVIAVKAGLDLNAEKMLNLYEGDPIDV